MWLTMIVNARIEIVTVWCLLHMFSKSAGQDVYSATIQWMPTGNTDEVQIYTHYSWKPQGGKLTCATSWYNCLLAYRLGSNDVQTYGRMTNYQWRCVNGCHVLPGRGVISDLSAIYFTDVNNDMFNVTWEAGDETIVRNLSAVNNTVSLRFSSTNGTLSSLFGEARLNLAVRSDTGRINLSPSLIVLPVYIVPLGCSIDISLHPYDGDGDDVKCRWDQHLPGAKLNEKTCSVTLKASASKGYTAGQIYSGSVFGEDYSMALVQMTRNGMTSSSRGPYSTVPVMFTVHVTPVLSTSQCTTRPSLEPFVNSTASFVAPFTYTDNITTKDNSIKYVTVGHQGTEFYPTGHSDNVKLSWMDAGAIGIYRTCIMPYNIHGASGNAVCNTLLVGDTGDCENSTCSDRGTCTCADFYKYSTCSCLPPNKSSLNIALIAGVSGGAVLLVASTVTTMCLCKRHLAKKRQRVSSEKRNANTRRFIL